MDFQTVGTPTVAVSTLVMAGSLVQVPTVGGGRALGGDGGGTLWNGYRFKIIAGALIVVCRLIVVRIWLAPTVVSNAADTVCVLENGILSPSLQAVSVSPRSNKNVFGQNVLADRFSWTRQGLFSPLV